MTTPGRDSSAQSYVFQRSRLGVDQAPHTLCGGRSASLPYFRSNPERMSRYAAVPATRGHGGLR